MKISKGKEILVLRFNNYKSWNFIEEHQKLIEANGDVWILKGGRPITATRINEIMEDGVGFLVLKEPKKDGGNYYIASIDKIVTDDPTPGMKYPSYYNDMLYDYDCLAIESLYGTWIHIKEIVPLSNEVIKHLHLLSNNKLLDPVLSSTRSSMLFAMPDIELSIKE
jgi:hypothetical protein